MPHICVRNATSKPIHAGFNILGMKHPTRHRNALQPGDSFDAGDFPGLIPQSFEVRSGDGEPFHDGVVWEQGARIAAAGALGSAAVGVGIFGAVALNPPAMGAAGLLMNGAQGAGRNIRQEGAGLLKCVYLWVWGFRAMEVVVREGAHGLEVWCDGKKL